MNYKAIIKRQSTVIVLAVICLTVVTISASYALFFQVETNSNNQIVTAGTLDVEYGSGSSSIGATELIPMSDDEALSSYTMTGTIYVENNGTLPAIYEVDLGNDAESFNARSNKADGDKLLSHDYLRIAAYLNGTMVVEPTTLSSLSSSLNTEGFYKLFDGTLNTTGTGESTMTIVIKVWLDESAPESVIGDYVYLKMNITSEVDDFAAEGGEYKVISGTGALTLNNNLGSYLSNYIINGNSVQNGEPSATSPVEVESVGDKTNNIADLSNTAASTSTSHVTFDYDNLTGTLELTSTPNQYDYTSISATDLGLETGKTYYWGGVITVSGKSSTDATRVRFGLGTGSDAKDFAFTKDGTVTAEGTFTYTGQSGVNLRMFFNYGSPGAAKVKFENVYVSEVKNEFDPYGKYKIPVTVKGNVNATETGETTTNIYLDEPLRKYGDAADFINFKDQTVTRKIKNIVLDGSTGVYSYAYNSMNGVRFDNVLGVKESRAFGWSNRSSLVGKYTSNSIWVGVNNPAVYWIGILDILGITLDEFKTWIASNNLEISYVLTTPEVYPITLPSIAANPGTVTIEVDTEIQPSDIEVTYQYVE